MFLDNKQHFTNTASHTDSHNVERPGQTKIMAQMFRRGKLDSAADVAIFRIFAHLTGENLSRLLLVVNAGERIFLSFACDLEWNFPKFSTNRWANSEKNCLAKVSNSFCSYVRLKKYFYDDVRLFLRRVFHPIRGGFSLSNFILRILFFAKKS